MAQTTGALSFIDPKIEIKVGAGAFTDIGGSASKLEADGFGRKKGEVYTYVGNSPILTKGKRESGTIKISVVYTEVTGEAFKLLADALESGDAVTVQWTAKPSATGVFQYTTAAGFVTKCPPPGGEAESGDPVLVEVEIAVPSFTRAAVA